MAYDKYTLTSIRDLEYESPNGLIKIKANFTLCKTEDGGRQNGIISGYRPDHVFDYNSKGNLLQTFIGDINFSSQQTIEPGETKEVTVRFLMNQPIEKYLNTGQKWWIHEGPNLVGYAEIV
jgi:translation elongation factor EF-Tu-like GTPase